MVFMCSSPNRTHRRNGDLFLASVGMMCKKFILIIVLAVSQGGRVNTNGTTVAAAKLIDRQRSGLVKNPYKQTWK
jgi:hypothetical protein